MLLLLEISFFIYLSLTKIYQYKKISGIVLKDDHLILILDAKERKILYKNTFCYLNSKKKKYLIKEDKGVIITKDNKKYLQENNMSEKHNSAKKKRAEYGQDSRSFAERKSNNRKTGRKKR